MIKKILITTTVVSASVLSMMAAHAATPGVYATGQLGYANTHMRDKISLLDAPLSNNGLAGRLAVGYQFNQNFGLELGYLQTRSGKAEFPQSDPPFSVSLKQNVIDLAGKGILPLANNFNVYGKLGVAYVTTKISASSTSENAGHTQHKWAPEAAVGVGYDITPNVTVDTSWTHIQSVGNSQEKSLGNIDFIAVGVGYNFG